MLLPPPAFKRASLWIALSALYYLGLCAFAARQNMMWVDEFCSWNLLSDPSWTHAFRAYSNGADSGGVLFYVLGRGAVDVFGLHPLVIRFFSSLAFWLAGLLWWCVLRHLLSTFAANAAVLTVWLGSGLFFFHAGEVRFYGLFFFTFSLAAVQLLLVRELRLAAPAMVASTFVVHLLLVTSHTIGLVYSAALLLVLLLSRSPGQSSRNPYDHSVDRSKWLAAVAIVASWSILLPFRQALGQQARISWMVAPDLRNFVRYYEKTPLTGALLNAVFLTVILVGLVVAGRMPEMVRRFRQADTASWLTAVLLLTPPAFAMVSRLVRPIAADRYMMPALCGFLLAFAASIFALEQRFRAGLPRRARLGVAVALTLFTAVAHLRMLSSVHLRPVTELAGLWRISTEQPVVLDDTNAFFQMRYYCPREAQHFVQLADNASLATPLASGNAVLLQAGYLHQVFAESEFLPRHPQFLYVDTDPSHASWLAFSRRHPDLRSSVAGHVPFAGRAVPVMQVTQR